MLCHDCARTLLIWRESITYLYTVSSSCFETLCFGSFEKAFHLFKFKVLKINYSALLMYSVLRVFTWQCEEMLKESVSFLPHEVHNSELIIMTMYFTVGIFFRFLV